MSKITAWRSSILNLYSVSALKKNDIIDKSRTDWKNKIEMEPENTIQDLKEDIEEPLKRTDLVRR